MQGHVACHVVLCVTHEPSTPLPYHSSRAPGVPFASLRTFDSLGLQIVGVLSELMHVPRASTTIATPSTIAHLVR